MKNIILKYYFKITALCIFSVLLSACSGLKVMIETEQPEDDFVVECSWASSSFKIHGGKSEVHRKAFLASSGEIVDCGTFWYGIGPDVHVTHPLYMGVYGCENKALCDSPYYRFDGETLVMLPPLKEKYLGELIRKFKGKELARITRDRLRGGFSYRYLSDFYSVKKIKPEYFKQKYEKRLTQYIEKLFPIVIDELEKRGVENFTMEEAVNNYWSEVNSFYEIMQKKENEYE